MKMNAAVLSQLLLAASLLDGSCAAVVRASGPSEPLGSSASAAKRTESASLGGPKVPKLGWGKKKKDDDRDDGKVHEELQCGVTRQVTAQSDKYATCPSSCPYFAQNRKDADHCTFLCVEGDQCGNWNPNKPIPDFIKRSRTCRGPKVPFCSEANLDGTDSCKKCQSGFNLFVEDGQCYFSWWTTIISVAAVIGVIVAVVVFWVVDLCCRETINQGEVDKAQEFRDRAKIMTRNAEGHRTLFPLNTNMCQENVAGPGMLLHFKFQQFLIIWPLFVAVVWTILACFHNELFVLGTKKFGTPRHNCILVAWGYETQQRLMWTKVLFLAIVYVVSFVSFLIFGIRQHRTYQEMKAKYKTMSHFALEIHGLPALAGEARVEKEIQTAVENATGVALVGMSVAWNYVEGQDTVNNAVKDDLYEREKQLRNEASTEDEEDPTANMGFLNKRMYNVEKSLFGPGEDPPAVDMPSFLKGLKTSETAFAVFKSEEDKMKAMEKVKDEGLKYTHDSETYVLTVTELECEPNTVNWHNFGDSAPEKMFGRFVYGFCAYYLPALAIWFFAFYVPYALSLYNFNYDNGAELPGYYSIVFTIIVVGGNATMYEICNQICDLIGFRYKDSKQTVYMLLYLFACTFNVLLDMVVTYYTALKIMRGLDFRTYDGTRLADIHSFTEQFETYAMQRSLAENTYAYAFPSTFLVPFLIEPFVTVVMPYQVGKLIVRTHREVKGGDAEGWMASIDFDLGRYADILLNVFLGILIFFFPGGYTWSLFYGMCISHIWIYAFDHWRVLDAIPSIKIVSKQVDWWAQVALGACVAVILSCLVFKANCESYAGYCLKDSALILTCTAAGFAHFIVHTLLLVYLVPAFGKDVEDEHPNMSYETVAKVEAMSWFSVNPVHCLRSKYIHQDKPYCRFASVGKEHLLEANPKIACYFSDVAADTTKDLDGRYSYSTLMSTAEGK